MSAEELVGYVSYLRDERDSEGINHPAISSVREHRGYLYLGGVTNNRIGRIKLLDADPEWTAQASYWGERG